jgi:hypothetical protein
MAFLRNLSKVVPGTLLAKPNNLILSSCYRPVFLETSSEANVEYLHSAKALFLTIDTLTSLRSGSSQNSLIEE